MTIYDINKFKELFLDFDFDSKLTDENNDYINSNKHYLDYKNEYLSNTNLNIEVLTKLLTEFNHLHNFYSKSDDNKYVYHFFDEKSKEKLNIDIKNIYIEQRKLHLNFVDHIDFLNNIKNLNYNFSQISNVKENTPKVFKLSSKLN